MQGRKVDTTFVRYPVIKDALKQAEVIETPGDGRAGFVWFDGLPTAHQYAAVRRNQRTNRIPGMDALCYKTAFAQTLKRMAIAFPTLYTFFPTTYHLPFQFSEFQRDHLAKLGTGTQTWILKPRSGCCGNGIRLIQNSFEAMRSGSAVCQRYVTPYLVDGVKFDFRFYVLIASLRPYQLLIYNEGLARFCTHQYEEPTRENLSDRFMHLTNTGVNVHNASHPRAILEEAMSVIERIGLMDDRGKGLWERIQDVAYYSITAGYSAMVEAANAQQISEAPAGELIIDDVGRYFHLLGIDVILNNECNPVVLEINDRPCVTVTYENVEQELKTNLLTDVMKLVSRDGIGILELGNFTQLWPLSEDHPKLEDYSAVYQRVSRRYRSVSRPAAMPTARSTSFLRKPIRRPTQRQ